MNCKKPYWDNTGKPIFEFKNYLVSYIHSIDPNFKENDIYQALYVTNADSSAALIFTNTPESSFEIKRILHDREAGEMFPGIKHLK